MSNYDNKVVFAAAGDGETKIVLLGIPEAAWEYMRDGHTHTFDLTKAGVPVKLLLFGSATHASALHAVEQFFDTAVDLRKEDFAIKPDDKHVGQRPKAEPAKEADE